jgi:hypothetical protein
MTTTNNELPVIANIVFGDFTEEKEYIKKKKTRKFKPLSSIYRETGKVHLSNHLPSQLPADMFIIFGDFTPEECYYVQRQLSDDQSVNHRPDHLRVNHETRQMTTIYYDIPCLRCGYHSHTVDNCIARRTRYGELIVWTSTIGSSHMSSSSKNNPVYYNHHLTMNNWCQSDKTDYTQFILSEEDVQEWIEEDTQAESIKVHPKLVKNEQRRIDYMLGYNQAITDYMLYNM